MGLFKTTKKKLEECGFKEVQRGPYAIEFLRLKELSTSNVIDPLFWKEKTDGPIDREYVTLFFRPSGKRELIFTEGASITDKEMRLFLKLIKEIDLTGGIYK